MAFDPEAFVTQSGITPELLDAVKHVESRGNVNAVSKAGAEGPYQFMPGTAKEMGLINPRDEPSAREAASRYLQRLERQFGGDTELALLAYNWGQGNVQAWQKTGRGVKGQPIPLEASQYVQKVYGARDSKPKQSAAPAGAGFDPEAFIAEAQPVEQSKPEQPKSVLPKATGKSATRQAAEATLAEMPWYQRALVGAGKSVADLGRAVGLMDEGDKDIDAALTDDTAGMIGNIGGEVALTAVPGGMAFKAATAPKFLKNASSLRGTVLKNAVGGAAAGATSEAMMNRDVGTGAIYGGVIGPAFGLAGRAGNEVLKEVQRIRGGAAGRATDELHHVFGKGTTNDRTAAAVAALRNTQPIVPGERVTAGLAANSQLPEFAVLEAAARRRPKAHLFTQADEATAKARTQVLDDIAAPGERPIDPTTGRFGDSPAMATRRSTTEPLYDSAMRDMVPITPEMEAMMFAPEVRTAVQRGIGEFRQAQMNARSGGRTPPAKPRMRPDGGYDAMPVEQLQHIVKQLDERLRIQPDNYEVFDARRQIMAQIRANSNDFATAQDLYKVTSAPQNRADVANTLRKTMNSASDPLQQRTEAFTKALRDAPGTFKKADLKQRFDTPEQVFAANPLEGNLGPQQLQNIRGVEQSLAREARTTNLPRQEGIVPEYLSPFEKAARDTPHLMTRAVTVLRSVLKSVGRRSDEEVTKVLDRGMVDPKEMEKLISALPSTERNAFINTMRQYSDKVPGAITGPATTVLQKME